MIVFRGFFRLPTGISGLALRLRKRRHDVPGGSQRAGTG
jgi:hypothetical protein